MTETPTRFDAYADILCPWCYIGHRRLATALADRPRERVEVRWRSVELAPKLSRTPGPTAAEQMAAPTWWGAAAAARIAEIRAMGAAEGLAMNLHLARPVNSFDGHRLVKLAATRGRASEVLESLLHGYHTEGLNIADHAVLEEIGVGAGLDRHDVRSALGSDAFATDVRTDQRLARSHGVTSVPSMVIGDRPPISLVAPATALRQLIDEALRPVDL
ncbi:DsbA family oxidoreductase [Micromonospora endophytica]|uniref:Disulfide bond formation protein DsbA n=1 Tax=Micromonospora endophytica TaxID=515350 RepID=A0A2W2CNZ3_9ACTN|nr:DsbA family oxidoreductase [Micromonospora endophytica]PZG01222.1 disulfide bond formation protein DsbA [Micromonospora endophytica]RIW45837.1 DsbA family oxidoreductase [Micromonospora endophytica]BCJ61902.1 DSBA oxidoreductase [Micromonospora endophytica]